MVKIKSRGKYYEIPESLEELTPGQYERFLLFSLGYANGMFDSSELRIRWLSYLIGMEDYRLLLPEYVAELDESLPLLNSFFEADGSPSLHTVRNLLPEYGGHKGPADCLNGFPFGSFVEALTVLEGISSSEDEEAVSEGCRHVARLLYSIPECEPVPELLLIHAPRLVGNVWRMITEAPVEINGEPIDFRIIFKSTGEGRRPDDHTGWTGITFEIAEKGLFGTVPEVEKTDLWAVLLYLYKCKFEYIHENKTV